MELETFISETLRQIVKGVKTAQQHEDCAGAKIVPKTLDNRVSGTKSYLDEKIEKIEFDVAVTVTEESEKKGGIGVLTGVLGVGAHASANSAIGSVSRIKFCVPLVLPAK